MVSLYFGFGKSHSLDGEAHRKPLPLTTVELQKSGSRLLKLAPKKILDVRRQIIRAKIT
jgi:hypothetical protein